MFWSRVGGSKEARGAKFKWVIPSASNPNTLQEGMQATHSCTLPELQYHPKGLCSGNSSSLSTFQQSTAYYGRGSSECTSEVSEFNTDVCRMNEVTGLRFQGRSLQKQAHFGHHSVRWQKQSCFTSPAEQWVNQMSLQQLTTIRILLADCSSLQKCLCTVTMNFTCLCECDLYSIFSGN